MLDTKLLDKLYRQRNELYANNPPTSIFNLELKIILSQISQILKSATEEELTSDTIKGFNHEIQS